MLHNVYYFMGRSITFTDRSAEQVASSLRKPVLRPYERYLISRLLNRQVKSAMHSLQRDLTREVLEELEKDLKKRSKAVWATCFCVISILCICMEDVQVAINGFLLHKRVNRPEIKPTSAEECIEICRKLDDLPFDHLVRLFHGIYKTQKTPSARRNDHIYNPIRDGPEIDCSEGLDQGSADLVNEIRRIINDHGEDRVLGQEIELTSYRQ
jgi:hypothetical protein